MAPIFFTALISYQDGQEKYRWIAFYTFFIAVLTDALDGALARLLKSKTRLGQFLDPLADKLLILSGFLGLLFVSNLPHHPPLWVTVTIVFRDLVLVVGMIVLYLVSGELRIQPNFLGKVTTTFQMLTLLTFLLAWPVSVTISYITAALTIFSGVFYVLRDIRKLQS